MTSRLLPVALLLALLPGPAAWAQSPSERDAARATVARHARAIVTVLATARVRATMGGREAPPTEENVVASGAILSDDGLVVLALSGLEPARLVNAMMGRMAGGAPPDMDIKVDLADLRIKLADGSDAPARVVLRDEDLDLAFLRPEQPPASPWPFVDAPPADVRALDLLVVVARLGETAGRQVAGQFVPVTAVLDSPRKLYFAAGAGAGGVAFDVDGRIVGLTAFLSKGGGSPVSPMSMLTGGLGGLDALGLMPVVVPIADIRDVARQAGK